MDRPEYHTARWQRLRRQVIRRDGPHCAITPCTSDMSEPGMIHVDHIIEMEDGAPFDWTPSHLQVVCKLHHIAKSLGSTASRTRRAVSPNA